MLKMRTTIHLSYGDVTFTTYSMGEGFLYTLSDELHQGKILIQSAYFGQPDRPAVQISLGGPSDKSGYGLTGIEMGDWSLGGVTHVSLRPNRYEMTPHPHPDSPDKFPLKDIGDPTARDDAAELLSALAEHYCTRAGFRELYG